MCQHEQKMQVQSGLFKHLDKKNRRKRRFSEESGLFTLKLTGFTPLGPTVFVGD
jgi:hypothetical protein